jgi:hypothetical protein
MDVINNIHDLRIFLLQQGEEFVKGNIEQILNKGMQYGEWILGNLFMYSNHIKKYIIENPNNFLELQKQYWKNIIPAQIAQYMCIFAEAHDYTTCLKLITIIPLKFHEQIYKIFLNHYIYNDLTILSKLIILDKSIIQYCNKNIKKKIKKINNIKHIILILQFIEAYTDYYIYPYHPLQRINSSLVYKQYNNVKFEFK